MNHLLVAGKAVANVFLDTPKEVYFALAGVIMLALFLVHGCSQRKAGYKEGRTDLLLEIAAAPADTVFIADTLQLPPVIRWRDPKPAKPAELSDKDLALINDLIREGDDLRELVREAYTPFELVDTVSTQARTMDGTWFKLEFFESLRAQPLDKTIPRSFEFKPIYLRTIGVQTKKIIVGGTSWWKYAGAGLVGVAVGVAVTK